MELLWGVLGKKGMGGKIGAKLEKKTSEEKNRRWKESKPRRNKRRKNIGCVRVKKCLEDSRQEAQVDYYDGHPMGLEK